MKIAARRMAAAIVIATLTIPALSLADSLELAAEQPTMSGTLGTGSTLEGQGKPSTATGDTAVYIVQLDEPALAVYEGGIGGMAATSPRVTGERRLNTKSQASKDYSNYLDRAQSQFIAECEAGLGHKLEVPFRYNTVVNGVAMVLSDAEAQIVAEAPGVKNIEKERFEVMSTDEGPLHINAPAIWDGPPFNLPHSKGEGAVIAILDSGINSDHPSFADIGGDGYDHTNPMGSGNYVPGSYCDTTDPSFCNDKLIGAWSFVPGDAQYPVPEDDDGHGSHTASTAAGNVIPGATLVAPTANFIRDISGVAPHANIVAYDVCIVTCPGSALVAAIDQVVIDAGNIPGGIHALNYSISGGSDPYNDAVEIGFLAASIAGVYVSASAGNSGPTAGTVAHVSPWIMTTAASTHGRVIENTLQDLDSDGGALADMVGVGLTSGYGPAPIVHAADFPTNNGSENDTDPAQCLDPFPAGTWTNGEIVVCDRGTIARVAKGANVLAGGAGGFVLANVDAQGESIVADGHFLPGVHIGDNDGDVLRAWLVANPGTTMASISGFNTIIDPAAGDVMAGFSSRGPNETFDVLKPDVTAPGVGIMAAVSSFEGLPAPEYDFLSGTSMSSPHNAGAGALMSMVQPTWTPYEIKSAIMMTSHRDSVVKEDGVTPADNFDFGAGRIDLSRAQEAGLVMNETLANFLNANPALGGDPSTLNVASMMDSACLENCSWTRTLKNVENHTLGYKVSTEGPPGLDMSLESLRGPTNNMKFRVRAGNEGDLTVNVDSRLATPGWNHAMVKMERSGDGPDLHIPISAYVTNSTNEALFNKTVDAQTAAQGEPLNYEISIVNGNLGGQIDLVDVIPDGLSYVDGSGSATVVNGVENAPLNVAGQQLTWSGTIDRSALELVPSLSPFGYFSLPSLGVAPFALPGNADDGGFILNIPPFDYNGATYNQVIWSVNGTIEAGTSSGLAASAGNQNLPDPTAPNNLIAPFWTDLNLAAGGNWYVAVLNAGPNQFLVFEWENVPRFGQDPLDGHSFQVWIQTIGGSGIWFVYADTGDDIGNFDLTVGVEDEDGALGSSYYFDGAGTLPVTGDPGDLQVNRSLGGSATINFQAIIDSCTEGDIIVNRASITSGGETENAIASTRCVSGAPAPSNNTRRRR